MKKRILITGATDGLGLETSKDLVKCGHELLIHGRNTQKLDRVICLLRELNPDVKVEGFVADLSRLEEVVAMASDIREKYEHIDVLINNAGVFMMSDPVTEEGMDTRIVVNTIAPYILTKMLSPLLGDSGRVINLSSAAQAPVDLNVFLAGSRLSDNAAYAQSKLALTMWSRGLAQKGPEGPMIVAVNPGSFLGSKMVKDAYGMEGKDLQIGVDVLRKAALSDEFAEATGLYYDNDAGVFADPHPDGLDSIKIDEVLAALDSYLARNHLL